MLTSNRFVGWELRIIGDSSTSPGFGFETIGVGIVLAAIAVVIELFYATPRVDQVEARLNDPD